MKKQSSVIFIFLVSKYLYSQTIAPSMKSTDCPSHCISCRDSFTCVDCQPSYFLNLSATCQKCSDNCKDCSKNATNCTKCSTLNTLNSDNSCSFHYFSPTIIICGVLFIVFLVMIILIVLMYLKKQKTKKIQETTKWLLESDAGDEKIYKFKTSRPMSRKQSFQDYSVQGGAESSGDSSGDRFKPRKSSSNYGKDTPPLYSNGKQFSIGTFYLIILSSKTKKNWPTSNYQLCYTGRGS